MNERPNYRGLLERRLFVAGLAGAAALPSLSRAQSAATPAQTLGPFYPRGPSERPRETDADLLRLDGDRVLTKGVPLYLTGRVVNRRGAAIPNATVEI